MTNAKKALQEKLTIKDENGKSHQEIIIEELAFVGKARVDTLVEQSISATIQAQQNAISAQNKIVQSKAEADQKIEDARGKAESQLLAAKAEAESITMKADAQAEANKKLAESLTPALLQYESMQKWNGTLPQFMGQSPIPFMQIPVSEKKRIGLMP